MQRETEIEKEPQLKHDIYLAGAWERYCKTPYKTIIKRELDWLDIYDPEEHQDGNWFEEDLKAIRNSKYIICYASDIPMGANAFELGYFYALQRQKEANEEEFGHIILIWEDSLKPDYAKEWYFRSGYVVDSVEDAVEVCKLFSSY